MRRVEAEKQKPFSTGRSRLLALVSIFGVLGIVALLVAISDTGTPRPTGAVKMDEPAVVNPSGVSVIPNSWAIAKGPFGSSKASSKARMEPSSTITAGDSKAHCITLHFTYGQLDQSEISAVTDLTGVTYNCVELFANPMPTWAEWETPWMFSDVSDGWDAWLDTNSAHQVVMTMDLIPQSVSNNDDPLSWEEPCAAGSYNQYAVTLAKNLASWGAGNVVIRLGPEANGGWEADFVGSTTTEMNDWAKCYDNEVTAMRSVPGTHFLFVWNPNACTSDFPIDEWYPGNSYVDIIGIDVYDSDCSSQMTVSQEGWSAFIDNSAGNTPNDPNFPSIANMEAFAMANRKPLSFPEWGLDVMDDPAYVTDMAQMFKQDDFSFESYFDNNDDGIAPLGPDIPDSTAAYSQAFK
jgi:Glycosyl hydrolase family 26